MSQELRSNLVRRKVVEAAGKRNKNGPRTLGIHHDTVNMPSNPEGLKKFRGYPLK
jgi:hypothetical protein